MATDSTNLPQGETRLDAGSDMTAGELDLTAVQLAQVEGAQPIALPKGNQVVLVPVRPGQVIELPTDSAAGLLAKIGPEGNLAIVVDGRTIILQGYLQANEQAPVKIVTSAGDTIDVADVIAATDPSLDIQTAAGPAAGDQGDATQGSGIFVPFEAGPGLGGFLGEGVLDPTALRYKLIDDERRLFDLEEVDTGPTGIDISFDILGGIVNEDDLPGDVDPRDQISASLLLKDQGNLGQGNDPFDFTDREDEPGDTDGEDKVGNADPDPEPLFTTATVKVTFGPDIPGTLQVFADKLPDDLTSQGGKIVYEEVKDPDGKVRTIIGFVEEGLPNGKFDGTDRPVFDIKVLEDKSDGEFHVVFTLYDNIDNAAPDLNGDGAPDLLGADEQILPLPIKLTATDSDGSSLSTVMNLGVEDDVPFFGEVAEEEGEEGIVLTIEHTEPGIVHDETWGIDGPDDVDPFLLLPLVPELGPKIAAAGFSLPFESQGATIGTAQTRVSASFGADQATQEHLKDSDDTTARDSVFGALLDRSDGSNDGFHEGLGVENERPFELFMIDPSKGSIPAEDDLKTGAVEGNLTIEDQKTNATVTWFGNLEDVYLHQIDAQTIVGYILVDAIDGGGENDLLQVAEAEEGESKELVFVLHIDDEGVLSFAQFHQINHAIDGPTSEDHDDSAIAPEQFSILGPDGTPIIHVRISDFDGDHKVAPVNLEIQDDGPVLIGVEYETCQVEGEQEGQAIYHDKFDNLTGWTVLSGGIAEIVGDIGTSDPQPDPANQALLIASGGKIEDDEQGDGASVEDLESFFGLTAGTLAGIADDGDSENGAEEPTDGSAIKRTFDVQAGDVLTVRLNFLEDENDAGEEGEGPTYQDFAFIVIGDQVIRLSNVSEANNPSSAGTGSFEWDEESGYLTFTYTFTQSGPVQIGFGVMNEDDEAVDPGLLIDELKITRCEGAIDEDALKDGVEGGPGDGIGGTITYGQMLFDFGTDRPGTLSIEAFAITDDQGNTFGIEGLKTADGNGVTWSKSGPDLNGVITWTAVEDGTGDPVFTFKLDTSGTNTGSFSFELHQALEHPFSDDPSDPADTNTAWEDNLHLDFKVKATDVDGDWTFGNVRINVDDDSPVAIDDTDSVTEGKGNTATGNVVTAASPELGMLGTDANGTDGTKDSPGADQPYTISKIVHGGHTYALSEDGSTVTKDGGALGVGESFVGGTLTIPTAEGGTFEIIMVSPTLSEVGEYRYTAGDAPEHASHTLAGPADAAASRSAAFDTLAEWTGSFGTAGITLTPLGGSLAIKSVNVVGPDDYRGIGVSSGSGDEVEVDNAGPDEQLQLDFATKTNNAKLTIAALFDGAQFDSGNQEILLWQAFDGGTLIASGQLLGANAGLVPLDIDTGGDLFDRIVLTPVNNGAGSSSPDNSDFLLLNVEVCTQEPVSEEFGYTLRDADGDESSATLTINVDDTQPSIPTQTPPLSILVDEDGLNQPGTIRDGIGDSQPGDAEEDHNAPNAGKDDAKHIGTIPFVAGADPVTIELSVDNNGDTGLDTVDGKNIFAAWDPEEQELVGYIEGTDPSDSANRVFVMEITGQSGGAFTYTFTLLKPVEHPETDPEGKNDNTENNPDVSFTIGIQIEDQDCDVAYTTLKVTIDDDMPVITALSADSSGTVQHDETAGVDNGSGDDDRKNSDLPGYFKGIAGAGSIIGWAEDGDSALSLSAKFGADGPGTILYGLDLSSGTGVDSGLKTTDGLKIWLFEESNGGQSIVVGRVGDGAGGATPDSDGAVAFAIHMDASDGDLQVAQFLSLNHPDKSDHDESIPLQEKSLLGTVTITDADGDSVTKSVDISALVKFDDDGPKAKLSETGNVVQHDETAGIQNPGSGLDMDQSGSLPLEFSGILGTLIGWAKSTGAVVSTAGSSFGADDEGASSKLSLAVSKDGVDSGIDDTATGKDILLYKSGDIVVGKVDGTSDVAFAVSIDPDGKINLAQYRAVEHGDPNNHDESIAIKDSVLQVVLTVTDGDGDTDTDSENIGNRVRFDDDGPSFVKVDFGNDEDGDSLDEDWLPVVGNQDSDSAPGDDGGFVQTDGVVVFDFGTDKAGSLAIDKLTVTDSKGLEIPLANLKTADGHAITISQTKDGATGIITLVGKDATDSSAVFTLKLDSEGGEVGEFSFELHQALDHPYADDPLDPADKNTAFEDNLNFDFTITAKDGDNDKATGHIKISIDDDSPDADKIAIKLDGGEGGDGLLVHDETSGVQNNGSSLDDPDASGQDEDDVSPAPTDFAAYESGKGLTPLGYAQTTVAVDLSNGTGDAEDAIGADRPGQVMSLAIVAAGGGSFSGQATNLFDTATSTQIFLFTETVGSETFVVGRVGNDGTPDTANSNGAIAFALHASEGGSIEVAQYLAIKHVDPGDSDESLTLLAGNGQEAVLYLQAVVADADGDSVTVTRALGGGEGSAGAIVFQDDGPTLTLALKQGAALVLDESVDADAGDPNAADELLSVSDASDIGFAAMSADDLFTVTKSYGADKEGDPAALFELVLKSGDGTVSGLVDTETGKSVLLFDVGGGVIEGRADDGNALTLDPVVFTVSVDGDGDIEVHQYRAVRHDDPADPDEVEPDSASKSESITEGALLLKLTITDGDGDTASDQIDLGKVITFEDDGPVFLGVTFDGEEGSNEPGKEVGWIDEDAIDGGIAGGPGDGPGGKSTHGVINFDFGSDKADSLAIGTLSVTDSDGKSIDLADVRTADGAEIAIDKSVDPLTGIVTWVGYEKGGDVADDKVFTFTLDTAGTDIGKFSFELHQALEHPYIDEDFNNDGKDKNGDPQTAYEDNLILDLAVVAKDKDGDTATGHIKIDVDDDSPSVCEVKEPDFGLAVDETASGFIGDVNANGDFPLDGKAPEDDEDTYFKAVQDAGLDTFGRAIGAAVSGAANLFTGSAGADGEASHAYDLEILGDGKTALKDTKTGELITLVEAGGFIQGQVPDGAGGVHVVFALHINAGDGQITMAQFRAVDHGSDQPDSYPDEVVELGKGVLQVTYSITDKDGDSDSESVDLGSYITFDDDGPIEAAIDVFLGGEFGDNLLVHDETTGAQNGDDDDDDPDALDETQEEDDVGTRPAVFDKFETTDHPALTAIGYASTELSVDLSGTTPLADFAYGSDGPGSYGIALTDVDGKAFDGDQTNLRDTETSEFIFLFTEGDLVVGRVGADAKDAKGGEIAFALSIDTDSLDLAQYRAIQHPDVTTRDESIALLGGGDGTPPLVYATVTVTDKDGDTVVKSFAFDDGKGQNAAIIFQDDGPTLTAETAGGSVEEEALPGGNQELDDDNNPATSNLADGPDTTKASGSVAALVDFGTDGAADGGGFSLSGDFTGLIAQNLSSAGTALSYSVAGNVLTAKAGPAGPVVFTLTLDADGTYEFELKDQIDHHPIPSADNLEGKKTIDLSSVVVATDGDGDAVTLKGGFSIDVVDDVPTEFSPEDKTLNNSAGSSATGDLDFQGHVGADEPGSITFAGFTDGDPAKDSNGENIFSEGEQVFLYGAGTGTIVGKTSVANGSDVIFQVALQPGSDTYKFDLFRALDDGSGVVFTDLSGGKAGNKEWLRVDNLDTDLLITPLAQATGQVNSDKDDIGINDQFVDKSEGVRIDFVKSPTGDQSVENGYSYSGHYLVNQASFSIFDIGGTGTASLKLRIVKADDDNNLEGDADDVTALLSASGITVDNNSGGDAPIVTSLGGGYFQIDGLDKTDTITITGDEAYNRLEIEGLDGKQFSIGNLKIGTIVSGDPLTMNFDVKLADKDGDYTTAEFNVTVLDRPVTITDLTPKAQGGDATVFEAALPVRGMEPAGSSEIADGNGSNNDDTGEAATGKFKISAPDGVDDLTIGGNAVITNGVFAPTTFTTGLGNELQITNYDAGTGEITYVYTLKDNETHPAVQGNNDLFEDLKVDLTDKDGDAASATLSIRIVDDVPDVKTSGSSFSLAVDESVGGSGIDANVNGTEPIQDGLAVENDEATNKAAVTGAGLTDTGLIGANTAAASGLFTIVPGADDVATTAYKLEITGDGKTGLKDTATGTDITLVANGSVIEGKANSGAGAVVFALAINATSGLVTMAQYRAVDHGSDGSNSFPDEIATIAGGKLQVTLTVTDKDGDTATASKDISGGIVIDDDGPVSASITFKDGKDTLDDEGAPLAGFAGIDGASVPSDDVSGKPNSVSFDVGVNAGSDGLGSIAYDLAAINAQNTLRAVDKTADGAPIVFSIDGGTGDLIGKIVDGTSPMNGSIVLRVHATDADTFEVKELSPLFHSGQGEINDLNLKVVFDVADKDGDKIQTTATVKIDDDMPSAQPETGKAESEAVMNTNLLLVLDDSGSMVGSQGATDLQNVNKLQALQAAVNELFEQYGNLGEVRVCFVRFDSSASTLTSGGNVWLTLQQAKTLLGTLVGGGQTNYDDALLEAMESYQASGKLLPADVTGPIQNVGYFISDGEPNDNISWSSDPYKVPGWVAPASGPGVQASDGVAGINTEEEYLQNFLNQEEIKMYSIGIGDGINSTAATHLRRISYDGTGTGTNDDANLYIELKNLSQLSQTLVGTVVAPVGGTLGDFGADGGFVSQLTFGTGPTQFTAGYNAFTNSFTVTNPGGSGIASTLVNPPSSPVPGGSNVIRVTMTSGSVLFLNMVTGQWQYVPAAGDSATYAFAFTLTDYDGDTSSNTLTVSNTLAGLPPIGRDDVVFTNVTGKGATIVVPTAAFLWNDDDKGSGPLSFGATLTNLSDLDNATSVSGGNVTIKDNNDEDGGSFTYQVSTTAGSDTADVKVDREQNGESTLDGNGLDNILVGTDSGETINAYQGNDVLLGFGGNDTLNGGDGRDWLVGGNGNDSLAGGLGKDLLEGGAGNDRLAWDAEDTLDGGSGRDTLFVNNDETITYSDDRWNDIEAIDLGSSNSGEIVQLSVLDVKDILSENGGVEVDGGGVFQVNDGGLKTIGLFIYGDNAGSNRDDVNFTTGTWTQLGAGSDITTDDLTGSNVTFNIWKGVSGADTVYVAVQAGLDVIDLPG